jgi:hypothetical protein
MGCKSKATVCLLLKISIRQVEEDILDAGVLGSLVIQDYGNKDWVCSCTSNTLISYDAKGFAAESPIIDILSAAPCDPF